jgi:CheY-like chemotaxis protein
VPRILLVADDIAEISAVKRVLVRAGHQTVLATNAADAATVVAQGPPQAAIISSSCDGGAGLELARRLAGEAATAEIPLLLLGEAGEAPPRAVQLPRPVDPALLAEELKRALQAAWAAQKPAQTPVGRIQLTAIGPGSTGTGPPRPGPAAPARAASAAAERSAAADALRQRAEELRRAGARDAAAAGKAATPGEPTFPWELEPPAGRPGRHGSGGRGDAASSRLGVEIDEELARLAQDDDVPAPLDPAALEAAEQEIARSQAEETRRRAEAQEESARQAEEARRRAEAEEESARQAEAEARHALAERAAARAASEEAARRRALQLASERKARAAAPAPPAAEPELPPLPAPPPPPPTPSEPELPPPPPELAQGTLAEAPLPRVLALAERARLSGRLDFGGDAPRSIYFEDGKVVGATSGAPHERVEEVALRLGLVTREQHRQAAPALAGLASRRAALALLDRGLLKPAELTALVRRRTEEVLYALFAEEKALFRYEPVRVPPDERIALERGPLRLAMEGVRRKWQEPRLDAVLGGAATLLSPSARALPPGELGLGPAEQRVLELADGLRALDEILDSSPLAPLETRQVLAGLLMVGALSLRFHGGVETRREAQTIDLARVREKLDQVRRADYFAILGLSRHATPYEVREAAERLAAEFDPGRYAAYREPGLRQQLDEILGVLSEAREILSDDELRAEYLAGLGE